MTHFTPIDGNYPYRMPSGAYGPGRQADQRSRPDEDCSKRRLEHRLREPDAGRDRSTWPGTPLLAALRKRSHPGERCRPQPADEADRRHGPIPTSRTSSSRLRSPAAGSKETFAATPNLQYRFTWDGEDAFGRTVQGTQTARVRVGYQYDVVYPPRPSPTPSPTARSPAPPATRSTRPGAPMPDPAGDPRKMGGIIGDDEGEGGGGDGWERRMPVAHPEAPPADAVARVPAPELGNVDAPRGGTGWVDARRPPRL